MKWLAFSRKTETPAAEMFDDLLSEVIEDYERELDRHRHQLARLQEAIGDR